jgi:type VI secretion system protein ImpC
MVERFSRGEATLDVALGRTRLQRPPDPDVPFRIAVLGDFSGRGNRGILETGAKLASRRPVIVDRDNFDQVLAGLGVQIKLPLKTGPLSLSFAELDDFHPDRLFERAAIFQKLKRARERLADPRTFAQAAAELGMGSATQPMSIPETPPPEPEASAVADQLGSGNLLDQVLEQAENPSAVSRPSRAPDPLQGFIRRAVEPHLEAKRDPRQAEIIAVIDRALTGQMRALLHATDFQAIEAAWRALFFLVRRVDTSPDLKIYLLDVSKAELAADLTSSQDLNSTGVYKLIVEQTMRTPGAEPWSVLAGNYTFGPNEPDVKLLGCLAKIAEAAGAPFVAAASPRLLGCESIATTPDPAEWNSDSCGGRFWNALRKQAEAAHAALALPRFLLRLPYGADTEPIDAFTFNEAQQRLDHENYLWGNPAFLCALLLAEAFSEDGWEMRPGAYAEVSGLPLHSYEEAGNTELKPCAEGLLTEDTAEQIMDHGLMPLVSIKGRDAVRLLRFQSIADPPSRLAGRWRG